MQAPHRDDTGPIPEEAEVHLQDDRRSAHVELSRARRRLIITYCTGNAEEMDEMHWAQIIGANLLFENVCAEHACRFNFYFGCQHDRCPMSFKPLLIPPPHVAV